ncbi:hypothetical protein Tdes44962_MAKER05915 [Teratosphaeria destructans]|uniref:Uncharacterized protein n=1 Tax=Teratosphaeria destructans TaxID=418781 RepID=A0A9W7VYA8_9PEZI|nr:hypothetical protein Tdes44962_MAKER05915 [Teratosphaeria destructans]
MILAQGAAHANNVNTKFDKLLESGRLRLKAGLIEFELHYSGDSCTIECTLNDHEDMKRWFEDAEDRRGPWFVDVVRSVKCVIVR